MNVVPYLLVLVAISANAAPSSESVESAWQKFKLDHGKQYKSLHEESARKAIFAENFNKIAEHNKLYDQGIVTFALKVNKLADMTSEEITKSFYGFQKKNADPENSDVDVETFVPDNDVDLPDEIDWREKGAVTPIKEQGSCGSCWAFGTIGALEGHYFLKSGELVSLSVQNLVDCSTEYGNAGCNGGDMAPAFTYIHDKDAIDSEEVYPYEGQNGTCRFVASGNVTSLKGYAKIESGNEDHLKAAVATKGPIAVAVDASRSSFQFYSHGVYYELDCLDGTKFDIKELHHAVVVIGYGTDDGEDYWLIKNSWGTLWGIDGFMKLARNRNNHCGIASLASFPINY